MPKLDVVSDDRQSHLLHPVVLKGISRTYHLDAVGVPAWVDIVLVILPDRVTVISGSLGSGKTMLLNLIGCIDRFGAEYKISTRMSKAERRSQCKSPNGATASPSASLQRSLKCWA